MIQWEVLVLAFGLTAFIAWIAGWPVFRYWGKRHLADTGRSSESWLSASLDGVKWDRAPKPRWFHQCWVQTRYFSRTSTGLGRCPCGGFTQNGGARWTGRNSRPRGWHRG